MKFQMDVDMWMDGCGYYVVDMDMLMWIYDMDVLMLILISVIVILVHQHPSIVSRAENNRSIED